MPKVTSITRKKECPYQKAYIKDIEKKYKDLILHEVATMKQQGTDIEGFSTCHKFQTLAIYDLDHILQSYMEEILSIAYDIEEDEERVTFAMSMAAIIGKHMGALLASLSGYEDYNRKILQTFERFANDQYNELLEGLDE